MKQSPIFAPKSLTIASRKSILAICQSKFVQSALLNIFPSCRVNILGLITRGDRILDRALSNLGGKGLFVKELENTLVDGRADLAVHSLKDMPMDLSEKFGLAAVLPREDPRDVVLLPALSSNNMLKKTLESHRISSVLASLPDGSLIGTSSLRRAAFISRYFPNLKIKVLRGNIHTRLSKLDSGDYNAIILAAAGLNRLGMEERISEFLSLDYCLPSAGQGVIGIEVQRERKNLFSQIALINDLSTALAIYAERAAARYLGGGCDVPLASYAQWLSEEGCSKNFNNATSAIGKLKLSLFVSMPDASDFIEVSDTQKIRNMDEAIDFGKHLGNMMCARGALSLIKRIRMTSFEGNYLNLS